ncbi:MAG: PqqD family protein [Bacteroidales bacterium]|nr:PqqD family protein [Bacteroidales bacterium]MBQ5582835.1 PqqD family protein [Bacteroidales bacterium]
MRFRNGLVLRNICGENVVVAEGLENIDFGKMIVLNESAKYLFEAVNGKEFTAEELISLLLEKYNVSEETAQADIATLCQKWAEAGLLI